MSDSNVQQSERYPLWYCRWVRVIAIVMTIVWSHLLFRLGEASWATMGILPVIGLFLLYLFMGFVWLFSCVVAFTAESIDKSESGAHHA